MSANEGPSTRSVHMGSSIDPATHAIMPPIVANSAFAFRDLEEWRAVALGETQGSSYGRNSNPTEVKFERKIAALEGAETGLSFATGMAAIHTTLFALLSPGDKVVTIRDAYGATYLHFTQILPRFGIETTVCETIDEDSIVQAISGGCSLLYLETPTNPLLRVVDLEKLISLAKEVGALSVVDNTFATPINQRPLEFGADLVIHSATKYLGGHNDLMGGVLVGRQDLVEKVYRYRELTGPAMDPQRAHLLLRSLKTLALRVQRQNENARPWPASWRITPPSAASFTPGSKATTTTRSPRGRWMGSAAC